MRSLPARAGLQDTELARISQRAFTHFTFSTTVAALAAHRKVPLAGPFAGSRDSRPRLGSAVTCARHNTYLEPLGWANLSPTGLNSLFRLSHRSTRTTPLALR